MAIMKSSLQLHIMYSNDPKFSDNEVWANSVDPDQNVPQSAPQGSVWSGSTLFADAQADLCLRWTHMPFCWFCHEAAHFFVCPKFSNFYGNLFIYVPTSAVNMIRTNISCQHDTYQHQLSTWLSHLGVGVAGRGALLHCLSLHHQVPHV